MAGGRLLRLIVQTAFPSINLTTRVTQLRTSARNNLKALLARRPDNFLEDNTTLGGLYQMIHSLKLASSENSVGHRYAPMAAGSPACATLSRLCYLGSVLVRVSRH